ncbi:MAG: hypothetical protein VKK04_03375, partial [Synechococcales bacterium]|nr:hypothetical protein [Synechococcales bacterium]
MVDVTLDASAWHATPTRSSAIVATNGGAHPPLDAEPDTLASFFADAPAGLTPDLTSDREEEPFLESDDGPIANSSEAPEAISELDFSENLDPSPVPDAHLQPVAASQKEDDEENLSIQSFFAEFSPEAAERDAAADAADDPALVSDPIPPEADLAATPDAAAAMAAFGVDWEDQPAADDLDSESWAENWDDVLLAIETNSEQADLSWGNAQPEDAMVADGDGDETPDVGDDADFEFTLEGASPDLVRSPAANPVDDAPPSPVETDADAEASDHLLLDHFFDDDDLTDGAPEPFSENRSEGEVTAAEHDALEDIPAMDTTDDGTGDEIAPDPIADEDSNGVVSEDLASVDHWLTDDGEIVDDIGDDIGDDTGDDIGEDIGDDIGDDIAVSDEFVSPSYVEALGTEMDNDTIPIETPQEAHPIYSHGAAANGHGDTDPSLPPEVDASTVTVPQAEPMLAIAPHNQEQIGTQTLADFFEIINADAEPEPATDAEAALAEPEAPTEIASEAASEDQPVARASDTLENLRLELGIITDNDAPPSTLGELFLGAPPREPQPANSFAPQATGEMDNETADHPLAPKLSFSMPPSLNQGRSPEMEPHEVESFSEFCKRFSL